MKEQKQYRVRWYGVVLGLLTLAGQHGLYLLGNTLAGVVGVPAFLPKIEAIDGAIPIVSVFIIPYVWSYAFWAMAPMAASRCDIKHFKNYMAAYLFSCLVGMTVLIFAPTYMDRVAEGLLETRTGGACEKLRMFWYTLDGGERAYNLFPSFHCINSTVSYLAVRKRPEVPKWFRIYSLVTAIIIYASTVFVKQHYVLDVVSGIAIALVVTAICYKHDAGRIFDGPAALIRKRFGRKEAI